jgi:Phage integrase family
LPVDIPSGFLKGFMTSCPEQTGSLAIRDLDFGDFCFGGLDWIAVCGSGFEPQADRFFDICQGLISRSSLGNTTGERLWKLKCPRSLNDRDLVLPTIDGYPMCRKVIQMVLDRIIEKAGIKRLTHHQLRHTFASILLAQGAAPAEVARLMGHKTAATTLKVYTHFVPGETDTIQRFASSIMAGGEIRKTS